MSPLALALLGLLVGIVAGVLVTVTVAVASGDAEEVGRVLGVDEWRGR